MKNPSVHFKHQCKIIALKDTMFWQRPKCKYLLTMVCQNKLLVLYNNPIQLGVFETRQSILEIKLTYMPK